VMSSCRVASQLLMRRDEHIPIARWNDRLNLFLRCR
jgi:hypothetical protein